MKRAKTAGRTKSPATVVAMPAKTGPDVVTVPVAAPRNPYVTLARRRKSGVHGESGRTRRQAEKRELRAKLIED